MSVAPRNGGTNILQHDPEKWVPVFPRDKRGTRLRGDHAQNKKPGGMISGREIIPLQCRAISRANYFLRKRSSRTTSAPSLGLAGSASLSAAGAVAAAGKAEGGGTAGSFAAGVSTSASVGSNCSPNFTEGSRKLLIDANGTTSRSGMPPNDRPTSKRSSVTTRSQN